uniref:Uncharacterized protein n=1 Tax=Steinernema glaseri TaxID=37863 RepID=A0A1I8AKW3_9BILA
MVRRTDKEVELQRQSHQNVAAESLNCFKEVAACWCAQGGALKLKSLNRQTSAFSAAADSHCTDTFP